MRLTFFTLVIGYYYIICVLWVINPFHHFKMYIWYTQFNPVACTPENLPIQHGARQTFLWIHFRYMLQTNYIFIMER